MKTLARPALRSAATSISTMAGVRIRALTERHPIKPTSPRCHSAWQLNLGRHSTYRRGKSVQTTGTTSLGPDGLSRFDELSRREVAQTAILHAFDLIEHDGEDLRNLPFLDRKAALARLLVSKSVDGTYRSGPCRVWIKVRNPASVAVQRERSEIWNRRASGSARRR